MASVVQEPTKPRQEQKFGVRSFYATIVHAGNRDPPLVCWKGRDTFKQAIRSSPTDLCLNRANCTNHMLVVASSIVYVTKTEYVLWMLSYRTKYSVFTLQSLAYCHYNSLSYLQPTNLACMPSPLSNILHSKATFGSSCADKPLVCIERPVLPCLEQGPKSSVSTAETAECS